MGKAPSANDFESNRSDDRRGQPPASAAARNVYSNLQQAFAYFPGARHREGTFVSVKECEAEAQLVGVPFQRVVELGDPRSPPCGIYTLEAHPHRQL